MTVVRSEFERNENSPATILSQRMMADDVVAIKQLYMANGFEEIKVDASVEENYDSRASDLAKPTRPALAAA